MLLRLVPVRLPVCEVGRHQADWCHCCWSLFRRLLFSYAGGCRCCWSLFQLLLILVEGGVAVGPCLSDGSVFRTRGVIVVGPVTAIADCFRSEKVSLLSIPDVVVAIFYLGGCHCCWSLLAGIFLHGTCVCAVAVVGRCFNRSP